MARRRTITEDGGVNLDSLLDALTNVVAVLILVLVLVKLDVTQKVVEFFENLAPATAEEVAASRAALEEVEGALRSKEALLSREPPTPEEIEEEKRQLALLEKDAQIQEELLADLRELKQLEVKLRLEKEIEEDETTRFQEEIAKLEARLDATPVLENTPVEVTIPNSRPIPGNARVYYALVFGDRVHFIDPFSPLELFMEEFRKHRRDWLLERVSRRGRDLYIYDQTKIVEHFKDFDFQNSQGQAVEVMANPFGTRLSIRVKPDRENGGTGIEDLARPQHGFGQSMRSLEGDRRSVVMFRVSPASFNTYLLARPAADQSRIPAGWDIHGAESFNIPITEVEVRRLKEPPPAKPNNNPKPQPPRIAPSLD